MKDVEWKLISELAKDSRRSDKQLAKTVGCSQPTVSRMIKKLETEGYVKEYTIIPDFQKLGYELLAFTFLKYEKQPTKEELDKLRERGRQLEKESTVSTILIMNGSGLGANRVIVSLHKDYSSYAAFTRLMKQLNTYNVSLVDSFLVSTGDKTHSRPLTFMSLAERILNMKEKEEEEK